MGGGQGLFEGGGLHHAEAVAAQQRSCPRARRGVGVGQQHGAMAGFGSGIAFRRLGRELLVRQKDAEGRAADGIPLRPDVAAVLHHDGAADGQTQAAAAFLAGVRGVHLLEAPEDRFQLVGGNSAALIDNREGDAAEVGAQHHGDGRVGRRELDGVGEQVREHLQKPVGVGSDLHAGGVMDQLHTGRFGYRLHSIDRLADDFTQLHRAESEGFAAALDAFQVEDVVNQPHQPFGVGEGNAKQVGGLVVHLAENARGEQSQRSPDGGEGCAQLVTDGGDELVLEAVQGIALADVAETEHGTREAAPIEDGIEEVLRRK